MATLPVKIDASGSILGAKIHNQALRSMQTATRQTQAVMSRFFSVMAGIAVFTRAAKAIADFELTMRKVQGVTGQTDDQMKKMIETARKLGATTMFSATEAGEGLLFLSRAGFTANEAMTALPSTLNLAAASGMALGRAADLASNVLRQFGLEASETTRVVDALVRVSNQANTDVAQLGEAMKMAGPIAGALGKSVEETAVLIGLLGDSGIQASQAGTNLRGVMLALTAPTDGAQAAMRSLGLSMHDLNPETNSMSKIFGLFKKAGLGAGEAAEIFGRRNAAAALILSDAHRSIEENKDGLDDQNTALKIAEQNADTLAGAFKNLISAVQELFLATGDNGLGGALRVIVDTLTSVFRTIAGMEIAVENNTTAVKAIVFALKVLVAMFARIIAMKIALAFIAIAKAIWLAVTAQRALTVAMMKNPFGLIAVAIAAAIVLLFEFAGGVDEAAEKMKQLDDQMKKMQLKPLRSLDTFGDDLPGKISTMETVISRLKVLNEAMIAHGGGSVPGILERRVKALTGQDFEFGLKQSAPKSSFGISGPDPFASLVVSRSDEKEAMSKLIENLEKDLLGARKQKIAADVKRAEDLRTLDAGSRASIIQGINDETEKLKEQTRVLIENRSKFAELDQEKMANIKITEAGLDASQDFADRTDKEKAIVFGLRLAIQNLAEARGENNRVHKDNAIAEFNQGLDDEIKFLGMEADAIELVLFRREALNFAERNSIANAEKFADTQEQKLAGFQKERAALEATNDLWAKRGMIAQEALDSIVDGLLDISLEGKNATDVIENLIRSLTRLIAKEALSQSIGSLFSKKSTGSTGATGTTGSLSDLGTSFSADGNVFQGGRVVNRFARGGMLVNSPMVSPVGVNLLGESGPEFVLPAARGADGKLGVRMTGSQQSGATHNNNQRLTITNNFYTQSLDVDSFRRSTRQQRRDMQEALRG